MTHTIAVALRKGGTGKTTTAVNLATALHLMGKRVLLCDFDPQANATVAVGIDPLALQYTINTLLTDISITSRQVIVKTSYGMDVLPSHPELAYSAMRFSPTQVRALEPIIQSLKEDYDYVIIDTPPTESYLATACIVAADYVLIPVQAHYLALYGLTKMIEEIEIIKKNIKPELQIAGILATMVQDYTKLGQGIIEQIKNKYPDLMLPVQVKYSIKQAEAALQGVPLVALDKTHSGAIAYMELAQLLIARIDHESNPAI